MTSKAVQWMSWVAVIMVITMAASCPRRVDSEQREGQRDFAGCVNAVDDQATLDNFPDKGGDGTFVCDDQGSIEHPFGPNSNRRACGGCHLPGFSFGLPPRAVAGLPNDHPVFDPHLRDQPRNHGLIDVIDVEAGIARLGQAPGLTNLDTKCTKYGKCVPLGTFEDRTGDLGEFTRGAVQNHSCIPGKVCEIDQRRVDALVAYMLGPLVQQFKKL